MALFTTSQPTISVRSVAKFPARVVAGTGITISASAGTYTIALTVPVYGASTVANLPNPVTAGAGARAFATDANATTFLSTVAAGGSNKVPVVSDGTNWLIG